MAEVRLPQPGRGAKEVQERYVEELKKMQQIDLDQIEAFSGKVEEIARSKTKDWTFPLTHYSYHSFSVYKGQVTVWFVEKQGSDFRGVGLSEEEIYA